MRLDSANSSSTHGHQAIPSALPHWICSGRGQIHRDRVAVGELAQPPGMKMCSSLVREEARVARVVDRHLADAVVEPRAQDRHFDPLLERRGGTSCRRRPADAPHRDAVEDRPAGGRRRSRAGTGSWRSSAPRASCPASAPSAGSGRAARLGDVERREYRVSLFGHAPAKAVVDPRSSPKPKTRSGELPMPCCAITREAGPRRFWAAPERPARADSHRAAP